jgi:hypothetical protein
MTARKREIVLRLPAGEYDALSWLAKAYQSTPEFMLRWYIATIRTDPRANPMAQPPGPPGGAGSASVSDREGETEVSSASQEKVPA